MGKSLEFVKQRIATEMCNGMEHNNYSSMVESSFTKAFQQIVGYWKEDGVNIKLTNVTIDNINDKGDFKIEIRYDPNAEFEYFTMERCTCDGTLFYEVLARSILDKLFHIGTYNRNTLPSDFNDNPFKYNVRYIVGDFVKAVEYGEEFANKDKLWMTERQTLMLPIKCEWSEKNE